MADDDTPTTVESSADEIPFTGTWETEEYVLVPDEGEASIGQVIFDAGLIAEINQAVLHRHGLAIGVTADDGKVKGINLHRTDDPTGVWFDEETVQKLREKQMAFGLTLTPEQRGCATHEST